LEDEVRKFLLILFSFLLWIGLSWSVDLQHILSGIVLAVICGLIFGENFIKETQKVLSPVRWFWVFVYIPVFVWEMAKANFDVAYRVLHPLMPIRPGIVKIKTKIKSGMGRAILANSITLTPGTFTVDIKDDTLYIHCIKVKDTDVEKASKNIAGKFEKILIKIFN